MPSERWRSTYDRWKTTEPEESEFFNVYAFFHDGTSMADVDHVDAETAVKAAKRLTESIGGRIGATQRVIITDDGDNTCFEWQFGRGVTFPPREQ